MHLFCSGHSVRIQGLASVCEEKIVDASLTLLTPLQDTTPCYGAGARRAGCIFFIPGVLSGYRVSGRVHLFRFMKTVRIQGLASAREEKLVDASFSLLTPLQDTVCGHGAGARASRMHLFYSWRSAGIQGLWPGASFLFHEDCPDTGSRQRS